MGIAGVSNLVYLGHVSLSLTYQETTTVKLWLPNPGCGWPNWLLLSTYGHMSTTIKWKQWIENAAKLTTVQVIKAGIERGQALADILCLPLCPHVYQTRALIALWCHTNATHATIANPLNHAQLGGTPYHSHKLHLGACNSVGTRPQTDRHTYIHTDRQTCNQYTFCVVYDSHKK